jgi:hypothetical protein
MILFYGKRVDRLKPMHIRATQIFQFFLPKMNTFCIYTYMLSLLVSELQCVRQTPWRTQYLILRQVDEVENNSESNDMMIL